MEMLKKLSNGLTRVTRDKKRIKGGENRWRKSRKKKRKKNGKRRNGKLTNAPQSHFDFFTFTVILEFWRPPNLRLLLFIVFC